jgi:hypothetical protein
VRGFYSPLDLRTRYVVKPFLPICMISQKVAALLDFCADAIIWLAKRMHKLIGTYWGGSVAGGWLKPGTICMYEDIACLISTRALQNRCVTILKK